eukprot:9205804-Pyramimonas_sp.AAC.1
MASKRPRYDGDGLEGAIRKQCIKHGASFLKYSETPTATKAEFSREAMTRSKDISSSTCEGCLPTW